MININDISSGRRLTFLVTALVVCQLDAEPKTSVDARCERAWGSPSARNLSSRAVIGYIPGMCDNL